MPIHSRQSTKGMAKPGSGRTKGAVSIVSVAMEDLLRVFPEPKMRVNVSRMFVEQFNIPYEKLKNE